MAFTYQGGTKDAPDYIYYNADIINNETDDRGNNNQSIIDPAIRFNETRDTALVKNCADYYFSIVRFGMNGPGKDLPLWLPNIQSGTGQINPNLTEYGMAVALTLPLSLGSTTTSLTLQATPTIRWLQYAPENVNPQGAPTPLSPSNPSFKGTFSTTTTYNLGDIVTTQTLSTSTYLYPNALYNSYFGGFYQVQPQPSWSALSVYGAGSVVLYNGTLYNVISGQTSVVGAPPPNSTTIWAIGLPVNTPVSSPLWTSITEDNGGPQQVTSLYYYGMTYQHFVDLWNITMYNPGDVNNNASSGSRPVSTCCICDTYYAFYDAYTAAVTAGATGLGTWNTNWNTLGGFLKSSTGINLAPPVLSYDPTTKLFSIIGDTDWFGDRVNTNATNSGTGGTVGGNGFARLFFNTNMNGLFGTFDYKYFNNPIPASLGTGFGQNVGNVAFSGTQSITNGTVYTYQPIGQSLVNSLVPVPIGYSYEVLFPSSTKAWKNILDYTNAGYVPSSGAGASYSSSPLNYKKYFWNNIQDFPSTSALWSPVASIVFTSTLLPVKSEAVGQPIVLGTGNISTSKATSQSAFQPIVTDIAIDQSSTGAEGYKQFIYYAPQAEYRLSDFSAHNQDIRTIDIQVFWKDRLTGNLIPLQMYNLSSVSIKCMFRRKTIGDKAERTSK